MGDDKGVEGHFASTVRCRGALISFGRPDGLLRTWRLGGGDILCWGYDGALVAVWCEELNRSCAD